MPSLHPSAVATSDGQTEVVERDHGLVARQQSEQRSVRELGRVIGDGALPRRGSTSSSDRGNERRAPAHPAIHARRREPEPCPERETALAIAMERLEREHERLRDEIARQVGISHSSPHVSRDGGLVREIQRTEGFWVALRARNEIRLRRLLDGTLAPEGGTGGRTSHGEKGKP